MALAESAHTQSQARYTLSYLQTPFQIDWILHTYTYAQVLAVSHADARVPIGPTGPTEHLATVACPTLFLQGNGIGSEQSKHILDIDGNSLLRCHWVLAPGVRGWEMKHFLCGICALILHAVPLSVLSQDITLEQILSDSGRTSVGLHLPDFMPCLQYSTSTND